MHEDFGRVEEIQRSSDRSFGLVIAAVFAIIALFPLLHAPPWAIRWWALAIAAIFAGCALFWTAPLAPLGRLWFRFGLFLGLLMRIFGGSTISSRHNRGAETYWIPREIPGPPPDTMKRQF
jgi:hypothetical protein